MVKTTKNGLFRVKFEMRMFFFCCKMVFLFFDFWICHVLSFQMSLLLSIFRDDKFLTLFIDHPTWHNILLKRKIKVLLADVILARYSLGMKGSRNDSWMNVGVTLKMDVPGLMYLLVPWIFSFAIFFVAEIRNSLGTRWALIWDNYLRPESKNHGW